MTVHTFPTQEPPQEPPEAESVKYRTIVLTNSQPVRIRQDEWIVAAESKSGDSEPHDASPFGTPLGWYLHITLLRHVDFNKPDPRSWRPVMIIYATFQCWDEDHEYDDTKTQLVRVGRVLSDDDYMRIGWQCINQLGDELRERIMSDHWRKRVTGAVDKLLANLTPYDEFTAPAAS